MPEVVPGDGRYVVTGGAGFIGSHLTDRLLAGGATVHVLDDLSGGRLGDLALGHARLRFEQITVGAATADRVDRAVADSDAVIHLAGPVGVELAHRDPHGTARRILDAGLTVVDACRRHGRPLLFASSSEVYGAAGLRPLAETVPVAIGPQPRWSYAGAKLAIERLALALHDEQAATAWVVRLFNVVGSRQRADAGHVVPSFCRAALEGRDLVVHGDGTASRTFLHVADAVEAFVAVLAAPALAGSPANIGGSARLTMAELADLVVERAGSGSRRVFVEETELFGEDFAVVRHRVPDVTRLCSATGWVPRRGIGDAVEDCLEALRIEAGAGVP